MLSAQSMLVAISSTTVATVNIDLLPQEIFKLYNESV